MEMEKLFRELIDNLNQQRQLYDEMRKAYHSEDALSLEALIGGTIVFAEKKSSIEALEEKRKNLQEQISLALGLKEFTSASLSGQVPDELAEGLHAALTAVGESQQTLLASLQKIGEQLQSEMIEAKENLVQINKSAGGVGRYLAFTRLPSVEGHFIDRKK
jgi:septation ring formation regulator EzrA